MTLPDCTNLQFHQQSMSFGDLNCEIQRFVQLGVGSETTEIHKEEP